MARISSKNQVTLPVEQMRKAGLEVLDEVEVLAECSGRIVVQRAQAGIQGGIGVFDGLYEPDYLKNLREGELY